MRNKMDLRHRIQDGILILLLLLCALSILAILGLLIFFLSNNSDKNEMANLGVNAFKKESSKEVSEETGGNLAYKSSVIGKIAEVLTIGYKIKVIIPCSDDFSEGDEVEVLSSYKDIGDNVNCPSEVEVDDIIIINYFQSSHFISEGHHYISEADILYGSKEHLEWFERQTDGKVLELIEKMDN